MNNGQDQVTHSSWQVARRFKFDCAALLTNILQGRTNGNIFPMRAAVSEVRASISRRALSKLVPIENKNIYQTKKKTKSRLVCGCYILYVYIRYTLPRAPHTHTHYLQEGLRVTCIPYMQQGIYGGSGSGSIVARWRTGIREQANQHLSQLACGQLP